MTKAIEAAARALAGVDVERIPLPATRYQEYTQAAITAYLAAMKAEGFVMVPVEASVEALNSGENAWQDIWCGGSNVRRLVLQSAYRAMIAAATHDDGGE